MLIEPAFRRSIVQKELYKETLLMPTNRLPFFNPEKLFVSGYGESFCKPGCSYETCQPYWSFQYLQRGTLSVQCDKTHKIMGPGDFFIVFPRKTYRCSVMGNTPLEKQYVMLNHGILITLLCDSINASGNYFIHGPLPQHIAGMFAQVKKLAGEGGENLQNRLSSLIYSWILNLTDYCNPHSAGKELTDLVAEINSNIAATFTLAELARKFGMEPRTLSRLFKKHLKCTPHQYIIRTRMRYAEHFLKSLGISVERTAELCGYKSFSFFCKEFRRFHGVTPSRFRELQSTREWK